MQDRYEVKIVCRKVGDSKEYAGSTEYFDTESEAVDYCNSLMPLQYIEREFIFKLHDLIAIKELEAFERGIEYAKD